MSQVGRSVRPAEELAARKGIQPSRRAHTQKALELVAMRGRDVIGVRHVLSGGTAWIGEARESIARIPMNEYGGHPLMVGAVTREEYALYVPPRARARLHGVGAVPRILAGPHKFTLTPGDRAYLVLGQVQIRAQIINVEMFASSLGVGGSIAGWLGLATAIYVSTLMICSVLAPPAATHLDHGAMQRLHGPFLPKIASR
jgi:hypothetical protein